MEPLHPSAPAPDAASGDGRGSTLLATITRFIPDLLLLLRHPRAFLAPRTRGRPKDVVSVVVFSGLVLLLSQGLWLLAYTSRESTAGFILAGVTFAWLGVAALSIPAWFGWRVVGIKRPYPSILVVLLHQGAVVYLAVSVSALIVITALQIHSPRLFEILLEEMLRPGASPLAVFKSRQEELTQAAESLPVLVAVCVTMVVGAAAIVWTMRSWAAYGDAFDTGPLRALIAALAGLASILLFVSLVLWVIT